LRRLVVIPNGVDEPSLSNGLISPEVESIAGEQPLILFFGRISWKKGLDRLLRAFACTKVGKLAIVGSDDEGLSPQLSQLATALGIGDRVRILPRTVIGFEKERLFSAAGIFVLTSYSENFGNTVLEAMRRCVPVVVTPEVGAADIVRESGAGLVVGGDPISLSGAIGRLASDVGLARSMGQAGQQHAIASYSWIQIATRMEHVYENLR
jgi:glycosyltransferase involved in cell wall biosynthesis